MTEEKIAEESLISYRKEPKWAGKMFMRDENTCYKDGFLAGLKAGKDTNVSTKWHKVADDDLPKIENGIVLCVCIGGYINNEPNYVYRLLTSKEFCLFQPVVAWCEIPKYTEE